jgi:hypothetical protein
MAMLFEMVEFNRTVLDDFEEIAPPRRRQVEDRMLILLKVVRLCAARTLIAPPSEFEEQFSNLEFSTIVLAPVISRQPPSSVCKVLEELFSTAGS